MEMLAAVASRKERITVGTNEPYGDDVVEVDEPCLICIVDMKKITEEEEEEEDTEEEAFQHTPPVPLTVERVDEAPRPAGDAVLEPEKVLNENIQLGHTQNTVLNGNAEQLEVDNSTASPRDEANTIIVEDTSRLPGAADLDAIQVDHATRVPEPPQSPLLLEENMGHVEVQVAPANFFIRDGGRESQATGVIANEQDEDDIIIICVKENCVETLPTNCFNGDGQVAGPSWRITQINGQNTRTRSVVARKASETPIPSKRRKKSLAILWTGSTSKRRRKVKAKRRGSVRKRQRLAKPCSDVNRDRLVPSPPPDFLPRSSFTNFRLDLKRINAEPGVTYKVSTPSGNEASVNGNPTIEPVRRSSRSIGRNKNSVQNLERSSQTPIRKLFRPRKKATKTSRQTLDLSDMFVTLFKCKPCGGTFFNKDDLRRHINDWHTFKVARKSSITKSKCVAECQKKDDLHYTHCPTCDKKMLKRSLNRHMQIHIKNEECSQIPQPRMDTRLEKQFCTEPVNTSASCSRTQPETVGIPPMIDPNVEKVVSSILQVERMSPHIGRGT